MSTKFDELYEQVMQEGYMERGEVGGIMSPSAKIAQQQSGSNDGHPSTPLDKFQYLLKVDGKWMGFNRNRGDRGVFPAELVAKAKEIGINQLIGNPNFVKQWR